MTNKDDKVQQTCAAHEFIAGTLERIDNKLDDVLAKLGVDYASIEVLKNRVTTVERVVYGVAGVSGAAIIIALISVVIKKAP